MLKDCPHFLVSVPMRRRIPKSKRRRRERRIRVEHLEERRLLAATPLGVTPRDTGEFLLGRVAVTPVLFESDGSIDVESQDWTPEEIDVALQRVTEGVGWWTDTLATLNTVHSLEFVIDDTFAVTPFETGYEPIDRSSNDFFSYVGEFVVDQGYGDSSSIEEAVQRFNVDQRERLQTDWAFTIFIVDSSDDGDGLFASGGNFAGAFAYPGGLFIVTPSARPASTIAHEMGHIFWARDEYSPAGSWTDRRGYYNTQNLNAANNPTPGFVQEISIMRGGVPMNAAYNANVSPESTLAFVGWQDSDGDGVFDVLDVPLALEAEGYFDDATSMYHFTGWASAVPLVNQNPSGVQSDITLNRVSHLQYSIDDGPWLNAASPNESSASLDVSIPINEPFGTIRWRVIDESTGISSAIMQGSDLLPALSASSISGIAFIDSNANGQRDAGEKTLSATEMLVRNADGSPIFGGMIAAADFPEGEIPGDLEGLALSGDGIFADPDIAVFANSDAGNNQVFHSFDTLRRTWEESWSSRVAFKADFDQVVGEVSLRAYGIRGGSYARLEAYDSNGDLLSRVTTEFIEDGSNTLVSITDPEGRIASIRAYGHADTSILIDQLTYGGSETVKTDRNGVWSVANLPEGEYLVDLAPEMLIHEFAPASFNVTVLNGQSPFVEAAASRVDSPRHNVEIPGDVSGDGNVTAQDALLVINDIDRLSPRIIQADETSEFDVDVNNDGRATALDALLVINRLSQQPTSEGEWVAAGGGVGEFNPSATYWAAAADAALTTFATNGGQMFNSAGRDAGDESIDASGADNTDQSSLGQDSAPGEGLFSTTTSTSSHQTNNSDTEEGDTDPDVIDARLRATLNPSE